MNFIQIADVHLGAAPEAGRRDDGQREKEIWDSFYKVIDICEEKQIDLLLIAGDLFHRQPLLRELKEINYHFGKLSRTKVVLIAGNHDYIRKDSRYLQIAWSENVYPLFETTLHRAVIEELDLAVYGFSYDRREIREARYDEAYAPRDMKYEILLAHGGDETHIPIKKAKLKALGYDYVALGHIHKPQMLLKDYAAFSGSLEPLDQNETGRHGFLLGEITEKGAQIRFVPFSKRQYIHLHLTVDIEMTHGALRGKIKEEIEQNGTAELYKIILEGQRDPEIVYDIEDLDYYGNIVEILDHTVPAYHYEQLYERNKENLLGRLIEHFMECEPESIEYQAMCEGVSAILAAMEERS